MATAQAGTVKVRSVSAPRSATAGASTTVDVTVARKGRTRATALSFYLSANAKRDGQDARLKGSAKVAKGRRSGSAHLGAELTVPAGQALGAYRVLACAGKSCAASKTLTVTGRPVGTRELVAQAVAAGKLSPEQGLVYRAFAAFDDHRLPAAYAGDDAAHEDSIMREVAESWPKLSTAQRKQVEPFFIPPAAKGSWASASAARATAAADEPACGTGRFAARGWVSTARKDGHVRIWWRAVDRDRFAARARALLNEAEDTIWRKLWDVFGRDALTDEGESCFHGPDGKLDIYLHPPRRGSGSREGERGELSGRLLWHAGIHRLQRRRQPADALGAGARAHPRVPVRVPGERLLELGQLRRGRGHLGRASTSTRATTRSTGSSGSRRSRTCRSPTRPTTDGCSPTRSSS